MSPTEASATDLRQIQIRNGSEIHLIFDGKVQKNQVSMDYFNDTVQLSLKNVSVYPAKIATTHANPVLKIFAYQYAPNLVRCRFTVQGKATDFKSRLNLALNGRVMSLKVENAPPSSVYVPVSEAPAAPVNDELDEHALYEKVIQGTSPAVAPNAIAVEKDISVEKIGQPEKPMLTAGKHLPSVWSAFGKMGIVITLLIIIFAVLKKFKGGNSADQSRLVGAIKRLTSGGKQDSKVIEILSTHYLDPKKSIAVVRIVGRILVLGISTDSINLITQIVDHGDGEGEPFLDSPADPLSGQLSQASVFSEILGTERLKPYTPTTLPSLPLGLDARSRIKNRLEGLKPL